MARPERAGRIRRRLAAVRRLPWRRIGIGTLVFVVLLVAVPPFRRAVSLATSRAILFMASPITPLVPDFDTHTFGHQHVVVDDAATGPWVLPGDAVYSYDNVGGVDGRGRLTPIGYGTGSQENSLFALARMLDAVNGDPLRIVPGHEAAMFERFPGQRFEDGLMAAEILVRPGEDRRWSETLA